jgi:hypothetical protein
MWGVDLGNYQARWKREGRADNRIDHEVGKKPWYSRLPIMIL